MTIELASLRLHPGDEEDLRWVFVDSAGDLGLRSNFMSVVRMIDQGVPQSGAPRDLDVHLLEAASRARVIHATLGRCGAASAEVLRQCYGEPTPPELAVLGRAANLVRNSAALVREHKASRSRKPADQWLQLLALRLTKGTASPKDRQVALALTREAIALLAQAQRAYARNKPRVRRAA